MSIARYTLICSLKSAHREVRHSTNKRLIDCLGLHLESLFLFSTYKSVLEIKLQNAFLLFSTPCMRSFPSPSESPSQSVQAILPEHAN